MFHRCDDTPVSLKHVIARFWQPNVTMPVSKAATAAKRQRLTLAQLAAYDDILTDALVDHVSVAD